MKNKLLILLLVFFSLIGEFYAQPVLQDVNEKPIFKISYKMNGGTNNSANPNSYKQGEKFFIKDPTRQNYIFGGWYYGKRDKGSDKINWDSDIKLESNNFSSYEGDIVLHARWYWNYNLENLKKDMITMIPAEKKVLLENFADYDYPVNILGYEISRYEVSQELFSRVMGIDPKDPGKNIPVSGLTFVDACLFCNQLTRLTMGEDECVYVINEYGDILKGTNLPGQYFAGKITVHNEKKGWRLPNSAEWEFAARGGTFGGWDFEYSGSNNIDDVAWYDKVYKENSTHHPCGTKKPNKAGLYDMSGNVSELCLFSGNQPVIRGGDYHLGEAQKVYFVTRNSYHKGGGKNVGLRICRSLIK